MSIIHMKEKKLSTNYFKMIELTKDTNYFKMKLQHIHAPQETLASNRIRISQHLSKSYQVCAKTSQACTPCDLGIEST